MKNIRHITIFLLIMTMTLLDSEVASADTITADVFIDMNVGNADGTTLTTTILNSSTIGTFSSWSLTPSTPTGLTVNIHKTDRLVPVIVGGTSYPTNHTSRTIALDNSHNFTIATLTSPSGHHVVSWGAWITFGPPDVGVSGVLFDYAGLYGALSGDFAMFQLSNGDGGTGYNIRLETNPDGVTTDSTNLTITPGSTYWITVVGNTDTSVCKLAVYTTAGTQLESITTPCYKGRVSPGVSNAEDIQDLKMGNNEVGTATATSYFENILVDYSTAVFPLGPGTPSTVASGKHGKLRGRLKIRGKNKLR
jgi:hypothetical protein